MPKVKFNEPVHFEGENYEKGKTYTLTAEQAKALGNSVSVAGKSQEDDSETREEAKEVADAPVKKVVTAPVKSK